MDTDDVPEGPADELSGSVASVKGPWTEEVRAPLTARGPRPYGHGALRPARARGSSRGARAERSLDAPRARALSQEDKKVMELVSKLGPKKWSLIASHLPGRIGKQCRERCERARALALARALSRARARARSISLSFPLHPPPDARARAR